MTNKNFTIEQLEPFLYHNYVIRNEIDKRRWYDLIEYVFEHEGKYYRFEYEDPATESQEDGWAYMEDTDEIECQEVIVYPEMVEVLRWRYVDGF